MSHPHLLPFHSQTAVNEICNYIQSHSLQSPPSGEHSATILAIPKDMNQNTSTISKNIMIAGNTSIQGKGGSLHYHYNTADSPQNLENYCMRRLLVHGLVSHLFTKFFASPLV